MSAFLDRAHNKLISELTQYDTRVAARERIVNIHRLPLLFQAADEARTTARKLADAGGMSELQCVAYAVRRHFCTDFPPAVRFIAKLQKEAAVLP